MVFFLGNFIASTQAQPGSAQEALQQYVADLQKNPGDNALREKIIKLVLTMSSLPQAPKDVIRHEGAAEFAFKNAKTAVDFADAAKEYEDALLLAPWLAQDYFNCGVAYEKAEKFDAAVRNFNLYLTVAPDAKDANDVLKRIGGLEYAANKVAKESSPEVVAAKKENEYDVWLKNLDGARFISSPTEQGSIGHEHDPAYVVYYINGDEVSWGWIYGWPVDFKTASIGQMHFNDQSMSQKIRNKQFQVPQPSFLNDRRPCVATISDDGQFLSEQCHGEGVPRIYTRIK